MKNKTHFSLCLIVAFKMLS